MARSQMVEYSKWDQLEISDDDDETSDGALLPSHKSDDTVQREALLTQKLAAAIEQHLAVGALLGFLLAQPLFAAGLK